MTHIFANKNPTVFFADLEQQANHYPVRSVKLTAKDRSLLGLFLMHKDAEATEVEAALSRLAASFNGTHNSVTDADIDSATETLPGDRQLKRILRTELDRVQLTRLPCSLIMLESDSGHPEKIIESIKECLHHVDIIVQINKHKFAIILPGTNLGKAILRAKTILNATLASNADSRMGIALYYANDHFSSDNLITQAEAELARTRKTSAEPICHVSGIRAEDACQVSVEERTQLFGFLVKDTN